MNQEEIKKLAIECGAIGGATCVFYLYELAAYTAAVEARERERCAVVCEEAEKEIEALHDHLALVIGQREDLKY